MDPRFRLVIFSAVPPYKLAHFLRRLALDLPQVEVAGVLYETRKGPLTLSKRVKRFWRLVGDREFRAFVVYKIANQFRPHLGKFFDHLLHAFHSCPENPNGPAVSLDRLAQDCQSKGIGFHSSSDFHSEPSLAFVRSLDSDFGVIYGTRILKPKLFALPRLGSINIHKHKVPEYRGSGVPGIWELRDGRTEATVTVHRVLEAVDAGGVLGERTYSIDPYDTLVSVGLKADLLAIDLLIDVIRAESQGRSVEVPQTSEGTVYKGFKQHQIFAIEQSIRAKRKAFRLRRGRPIYKLILRTLLYPVLFFRNRRRRARKNFPVIMLFHHLITDKPKYLGLPTEQFVRQVRFLKKHYKIASLPEAIDMLRKDEVPVPTVVLTFDDGYAENFLCLRAVAEAENIPVSLFVCTETVSRESEFPHDLERNESGFPAMSWDQVRYFDRHNVIIGSHTRNHFDCRSGVQEALNNEIVGSREDLIKELGHDVEFFSFPKGQRENMSEPAVQLAHKTFPYVFSAFGGVNDGPLSLSGQFYRYSHPDSLWELELLLQSVLEFEREPKAGKLAPGPMDVSEVLVDKGVNGTEDPAWKSVQERNSSVSVTR